MTPDILNRLTAEEKLPPGAPGVVTTIKPLAGCPVGVAAQRGDLYPCDRAFGLPVVAFSDALMRCLDQSRGTASRWRWCRRATRANRLRYNGRPAGKIVQPNKRDEQPN